MLTCLNCGHTFLPDEHYCPDCGALAPSPLDATHIPDGTPTPLTNPWPYQTPSPAPLPWAPQPTPPFLWSAEQHDGRPTPVPPATRGDFNAILVRVALILLTVLVLVGAGIALHQHTSSAASSFPTSTTGHTPHPTVGPHPSPAPLPTCSTILSGSAAPSAGGNFGDVPFPSGATSTALNQVSSDTGRYTVAQLKACAPTTSMQGIADYYTQAMEQNGWSVARDKKVPYDGGYMVPCTNAAENLCWSKDFASRFVSLESSQAVGNGFVVYSLDLFVPPPEPTCPSSQTGFTTYLSFWTVDNSRELYIALPPLSLPFNTMTASSQTIVNVCSAGTVDSILSFLNYTLITQHWSQSSSVGSSETWTASGYTLVVTVSDPANWQLNYTAPGA